MTKSACETCRFAEWERTANGRRHPSGKGLCKTVLPAIPTIPAAFSWIGYGTPRITGGTIWRSLIVERCAFHEERANEP